MSKETAVIRREKRSGVYFYDCAAREPTMSTVDAIGGRKDRNRHATCRDEQRGAVLRIFLS